MDSSCINCNSSKAILKYTKNGFNLLECTNCKLCFIENPLNDVDFLKLYSFGAGYHNNLTDLKNFDLRIKYSYRDLKKIEGLKKTGKLLDIGCSVGYFMIAARNKGWSTVGIEFSVDTAKTAAEKYNLNVIQGTTEQIDLGEEEFDVIVLRDLIEHVKNPLKTMSFVNKHLKNDGIVFITTPNIDGLFPKLSYHFGKKINYWPHPEPPFHLYQFSLKTIKMVLAKTGFNIIKIYTSHIPLLYSFGGIRSHLKNPIRIIFTGLFLPSAIIGPLFKRGDTMTIVAQKMLH